MLFYSSVKYSQIDYLCLTQDNWSGILMDFPVKKY